MSKSKTFKWRAFLSSTLLAGLLLTACHSRPEGVKDSAKYELYLTQGEQLYATNCSNCHQKSGTGLGRVYPPLNQSDFIDNHFEEVLCLMRYGRKGELTVNGKMFNQAMPATALTDLEIAEIATFVYNSWGRTRGIIEVNTVSSVLQKCVTESIN
jgi:mono/diheme cytochrome c family protein